MNPETGKFEHLDTKAEFDIRMARLHEIQAAERALWGTATQAELVRPDGTPVPPHWPVFTIGEYVLIRDHTYRVAYITESSITFEPVPLGLVTAQEKVP